MCDKKWKKVDTQAQSNVNTCCYYYSAAVHMGSDGYLALPALPSLWRGGIEDRPSFESAPTLDNETDILGLSYRVTVVVSHLVQGTISMYQSSTRYPPPIKQRPRSSMKKVSFLYRKNGVPSWNEAIWTDPRARVRSRPPTAKQPEAWRS
jgi:hypothetical protein